MRIKNIILSIIAFGSLFSCYKDLGNYEYKDINEITVSGIEANYAVDADDSLNIYPSMVGTMYSDTSKFSYEWEVGRRIIANTFNLKYVVNLLPETFSARFIVTDKVTEHKNYHRFTIRVSSSTAGDLIVVLSKYQSRAELSYYRLDKPANFAINYYKDRFGVELGLDPQQLHVRYCGNIAKDKSAHAFSAVNAGKVMVLADSQIKLIDKMTMSPDTVFNALTEQNYLVLADADITDYKSQFIVDEGFSIWSKSAYGSGTRHQTYFYEISNGKLYFATHSNGVWSQNYNYDAASPYNKGPLSPFAFYDQNDPTPHDNLKQAGYKTGNLMTFDYKAGRFAYASSGTIREIGEARMEIFKDYQLIYGSSTVMPDNTFFAVLNNGTNNKLLLVKRTKETSTEKDKDNVYTIIAQITCDNTIINRDTRFYVTKYSSYMFFTHGNKLYRYNMNELGNGVVPGEQHVIAKLTDYGYDASAKITAMFFTRSEHNILLGVSRYGNDLEAEGEEEKGDILAFSYSNETMQITHNPKYTFKGISGIPVDIKVKYQTHWRDGIDFDEILIDNI